MGAPRSRPRRRPAPSDRRRSRSRRRNQRSELGARVLAAVPAVAFAIFIVSQGGLVFAVAVLGLGLICLHELFRMYDRVRPVRLAGFLALAGLALGAHFGGERQVLLGLVAFLPLLFLIAMAMPERRRGPTVTASMAITTFGVYWIGIAIASVILLRALPHGGGIIVDVLVGTFIGDTGAYLGGRAFGQRPLAPRISPNKTVEGLLIGILCAIIATWAAGLYQDWLGQGQALLLGLAVALLAPLGDLFESRVKRDAGTKDAGSLFGAHGGALDRLDAALFTLVGGYFVWLAML